MARLDRLLRDLGDLPLGSRAGGPWLLRRFYQLGEVSEPPTVEPPEWLQQAIVDAVRDVSQSWPQNALFGAVRMLERFGLVDLVHDDVYVLAMVSCLGDRWDGAVRAEALRRDPELRELVWRVFEVEGNSEVSLANVDKYSGPDGTWAQTFRVLVADGTLPRERVLAECLRALGRDFSAYRATWYAQVYRSLKPTRAERVAGQPLLLGLLRSAVPATVSFAVAQLSPVELAGALDDDQYVAACVAATIARARTAAIAAIDLAVAVMRRRPDLTSAVIEAVAGALGHSHREVQSHALAALRSVQQKASAEAMAQVAARLEELEPSVRRDAAEWLGVPDAPPGEVEAQSGVPFAAQPVPVVAAASTVMDLGTQLLAGHLGTGDVERFLAALAIGDVTGLAALRDQAARELSDPRSQRTLRRSIAALVVMAAGDPEPTVTGPVTFLGRRLGEVADVLAGRRPPAPLLATPTEPGGWLDPRTLVARVAADPSLAPPKFDLLAALLRLAPDGRCEALGMAASLPGETGAVIRYALGGEPAEVKSPPLWVAAARVRAPLDDDPYLISVGLDGAGQGRTARYSLRFDQRKRRLADHGNLRVRVAIEPALEVTPPVARVPVDQPTVVGPWDDRNQGGVWRHLDSDWIDWHAQIWPHDAEPFFAVRVGDVLTASGQYPVVTYGTPAILDVLATHPGRMGPMAAATLAAGLSAKEVQHRVLAAEAFAQLVPAGRIPAVELAASMGHLAGQCLATRWGVALRDVARTDRRVALAVVEVLDHLLPRLDPAHPGLYALLETRLEEAVRLGRRTLGEPLESWLLCLPSGFKAARVAEQILTEAAEGSDRW